MNRDTWELELECIMGELNHPNHNGRIYDSNMMKEAIEKWQKDGNKIVELNPNYDDFMKPNILNAAGEAKDIWMEDNKVIGKIQLLDTPQGKVAKEMFNTGKELYINPRMLGEKEPALDENGNQKFDENGNQIYEIKDVQVISFDIV